MYKSLALLWGRLSDLRRRQLIALVGLMFVCAILEMAAVGAVIPLLGMLADPNMTIHNEWIKFFFQQTESTQLVIFLTLAMMGLTVFSGFLRVALVWYQAKISHAIGVDISSNIYRSILLKDYEYHQTLNSNEVISILIHKTNSVVYNIVLPITIIISSSLMIVGIGLMIFIINPKLASIAIFFTSLVYLFLNSVIAKNLRTYGEIVSKESSSSIKQIQESLSGIRDLIIDGYREVRCDSFYQTEKRSRDSQAKVQIIGSTPRYIIEMIATLTLLASVLFLVSDQDDLIEFIPTIGALFFCLMRILPLAQQIFASISNIRGGEASLIELLDVMTKNDLVCNTRQIELDPVTFFEDINLVNLYYKYSRSTSYCFESLNLKINRGDVIGLIGKTASGKSTLIDLISGLLAPTSGLILVDGNKLAEVNSRSWQKNIAYVPQNIFILNGNVLDNVVNGRNVDININRVCEALRLVDLYDELRIENGGLYALVGERGTLLSGGQRQRLGIARAIYKGANLLILDECTSALDVKTERKIIESIKNTFANSTIIMVTHRFDNLKICNRVIEVRENKIFELEQCQ